MVRLDLQEVCLSVKALGFPDIRHFLNSAISPPDERNLLAAINRLKSLQVCFFFLQKKIESFL